MNKNERIANLEARVRLLESRMLVSQHCGAGGEGLEWRRYGGPKPAPLEWAVKAILQYMGLEIVPTEEEFALAKKAKPKCGT